MTGDLYALKPPQGRALCLAVLVGLWAAWVEGAATGGIERVGHLALNGRAGGAAALHLGDGVEQHAGVGVARLAEQGVLVGQLDQPAQVHHADLVADMTHHCEVVRDEEVGQAAAALQLFHDVEHLGLHAHVERRGWLIADQKLRRGGQGPGDRDALALAAGKLVRVFAQVLRR